MTLINETKERLRDEIRLSADSLLDKYPVDRYIQFLDRYPTISKSGYHYVSPDVKTYTESILNDSSEDILEKYHQLVLIELILRNKDKIVKQELPDEIKKQYDKNFDRILNNISSKKEELGFYLYPNDKFCKDLAVCTQKMIPVGCRKLVSSPCPQRFVLKKGLGQFISGMSFVLFRLGGIRPTLYVMHTDSHDPDLMAEFNVEGWTRTLLVVAELLKQKKEVKGVFATSWFYDPNLEEVSPRLNYNRKIITDNGGKVFYIGPSEQTTKDALTKSETRRRLYSEGKYVPTNYIIFWSRKKLLEWASKAPPK